MDLHVRKQKPSDRFRFVAAFEAATTSPHIQCPLLVLMDWPRTAASISRHEPLRTKPKLNPSSSLPHRSHRNWVVRKPPVAYHDTRLRAKCYIMAHHALVGR